MTSEKKPEGLPKQPTRAVPRVGDELVGGSSKEAGIQKLKKLISGESELSKDEQALLDSGTGPSDTISPGEVARRERDRTPEPRLETERMPKKRKKPKKVQITIGEDGVPDDPTIALPDWVIIPNELVFPRGKIITFMKFPAAWTDKVSMGDRQCILWNLTMDDEDLALRRCKGDSMRIGINNAMGMIRAVDGCKADWTGTAKLSTDGNVKAWMNELGAACRSAIQSYYMETHALKMEQRLLFFKLCTAVRTYR